jgi:hypothetical protein
MRVHDVQPPLAIATHVDQAGIREYLQVLRDGLLRDIEVLADLPD